MIPYKKNLTHLLKKCCYIVLPVIFIISACRDYYDAEYETPEAGFLVVEGFINYGTAPTVIKLSRSTKPSESTVPYAETGASIQIESDQNEHYALTESVSGTYTSGLLNLSPSKKYRIVIQAKGKQYQSQYSGVQTTPEIDSITWKQESNGIELWVNASDPANSAVYYQWKFEETWEILSPFTSNLMYDIDNQQRIKGVKYRYADESIDTTGLRCWQQNKSSNLLLGSTEKLSQDVVHLPFHVITANSEKLGVLYSVLLKQYKLSSQAYEFLLQMKKNNEQLGSIFDAQPSELPGNIVCSTIPTETVVGFVEVMQEKTKRIFISRNEIGTWNYTTNCGSSVIANHPDSIVKYGLQLTPTNVFIDDTPKIIISFNAAPPRCVDCRLNGGTNVKPSFWP
jgi:hypothetical protein